MNEEDLEREAIRKRQKEVTESGSSWEDYVFDFLTERLKTCEDIKVRKVGNRRELETLKQESPNVYRSMFIPILNFARNKEALSDPSVIDEIFSHGVVGDTDIVVYSEKHQIPFVVVSCKLSLHGRLTETLFYSLYFRITSRMRFVLATPDKGKQSSSEKWESEWGTPESPTKDRILSTLFLDGVYVENVPRFMPRNFDPTKHSTAIGGIVRPLEELPKDIVRWYEDVKFSLWKGLNL